MGGTSKSFIEGRHPVSPSGSFLYHMMDIISQTALWDTANSLHCAWRRLRLFPYTCSDISAFPPPAPFCFFWGWGVGGEGAAGWFSHNDCRTKNVSAQQKDLCPPGGVEDNQWCNAECPARAGRRVSLVTFAPSLEELCSTSEFHNSPILRSFLIIRILISLSVRKLLIRRDR